MASSTTMPMASIKPNRVSRLSENPNISMNPNVPISDMGTAMMGMTVARQLCNDRYTTIMTSMSASKRVL